MFFRYMKLICVKCLHRFITLSTKIVMNVKSFCRMMNKNASIITSKSTLNTSQWTIIVMFEHMEFESFWVFQWICLWTMWASIMFRMIYQEMLSQNIVTSEFSGTYVARILLLLFDTFGFANFSVNTCLLVVMFQRLRELPSIKKIEKII